MQKYQSIPQDSSNEFIDNDTGEIMNFRPGWIIRKGNTFFFLFGVLMFASSWIIQIPSIFHNPIYLHFHSIYRTEAEFNLPIIQSQKIRSGQAIEFKPEDLEQKPIKGKIVSIVKRNKDSINVIIHFLNGIKNASTEDNFNEEKGIISIETGNIRLFNQMVEHFKHIWKL